jgi:ACS family phthalate transporter-like MFS transporter
MHIDGQLNAGVREAGTNALTAYRKVFFRLLPLLFLCYVVNFIDRSNIAMAKLQFKDQLGFSEATYGLGAGLFYVGYLILEVPSNLLLARIGARATFTRIMVVWGVVSTMTMFIRTPLEFYCIRVVLGAAEAGFIPGTLLYLSYWFPTTHRARMNGIFFVAVPVAAIIGNPVAGAVIQFADGWLGFHGWQWLFLIEGLPAVLLGIVAYFYLDNRPEEARWLTVAEKQQIFADLALEEASKPAGDSDGWFDVLKDPRTYVISYVLFSSFTLATVISFWAPTIIRASGIKSYLNVGLLGAIPPIIGVVCLLVAGWHSDRRNERRWHVAVPLTIAALGLALLPSAVNDPVLALGTLVLVIAGHYSTLPVIWSIPSDYVSSRQAAAGIALMSCLGASGGAIAPGVLGWINKATGSLETGLLISAGVALVIGVPRQTGKLKVASATS